MSRKKLFAYRVFRIAARECRETLRDGRIPILGLVLALLAAASLYIGRQYYDAVSADKQQAQRDVRELWLNQSPKNPHAAGHYGVYAFKPLSPLAQMEKGVNSYQGETLRLETHFQHTAENRLAEDETWLLRFGELTPGFVLLYLVPLFIIALAHTTFSRERELGTLRLSVSQGIGGRELFWGKLLSTLLVMGGLVLPVFTAVHLLVSQTGEAAAWEAGMALLLIFLGYALYYAVYLLVAMGVSARCGTSRKALVILFGFWLFASVLFPKLATLLSETAYPAPSAFAFTVMMEKTSNSEYPYVKHREWLEVNKRIAERLMKKYGVSTMDSVPVATFGYALQEEEERLQQENDRNFARISDNFARQNRLHRLAAFTSPLSCMRFMAMGLSATDAGEHAHYLAHSEQYRREVMEMLNSDIAENQKDRSYTQDRKLWERIPEYEYPVRPLEERLSDILPDIAGLALWLLASCLFVFFSLRHLTI